MFSKIKQHAELPERSELERFARIFARLERAYQDTDARSIEEPAAYEVFERNVLPYAGALVKKVLANDDVFRATLGTLANISAELDELKKAGEAATPATLPSFYKEGDAAADEALAELEHLLTKASFGPWRQMGSCVLSVNEVPILTSSGNDYNLDLTVALRNAAPALLAEIKRLRATPAPVLSLVEEAGPASDEALTELEIMLNCKTLYAREDKYHEELGVVADKRVPFLLARVRKAESKVAALQAKLQRRENPRTRYAQMFNKVIEGLLVAKQGFFFDQRSLENRATGIGNPTEVAKAVLAKLGYHDPLTANPTEKGATHD